MYIYVSRICGSSVVKAYGDRLEWGESLRLDMVTVAKDRYSGACMAYMKAVDNVARAFYEEVG